LRLPQKKDREHLQKRPIYSDEEIAEIIEEATVDSYGRDEEINSWAAYLEDELAFPFLVKILGKTVQVIKIEEKYNSLKLVVISEGKKYQVDVNDVEVVKSETLHIRNELLLNAYRKWCNNE